VWCTVRPVSGQSCSHSTSQVALGCAAQPALRERAGKCEGVHHPDSELLFREFVEALVRIAQHLYHDLPSLERRLHHLINLHILPFAGKAEGDRLKMEMDGEDVKVCSCSCISTAQDHPSWPEGSN